MKSIFSVQLLWATEHDKVLYCLICLFTIFLDYQFIMEHQVWPPKNDHQRHNQTVCMIISSSSQKGPMSKSQKGLFPRKVRRKTGAASTSTAPTRWKVVHISIIASAPYKNNQTHTWRACLPWVENKFECAYSSIASSSVAHGPLPIINVVVKNIFYFLWFNNWERRGFVYRGSFGRRWNIDRKWVFV